ncbi:hypothetical protein [Neobacillus vireti]|uniref:hypothetical protein n=1 Tax=Neobacillus vireti TaxID=220686 RepID=UPI002FFFA155
METILFLIIAGILSTLFGKSKGKGNGPTKPFTAKGFDDFRTRVEQQMGGFPRKTEPISTGEPVVQKLQNIEETYQQMKSVSPSRPVEPVKPITASRLEVKTEDNTLEKPDEKTIINGIIWAEILGEPRAKKPYIPRKG